MVRLITLLGALIIQAGCSTTFQTFHEPMHPIGDYTHLKMSATGLIDRIELRVHRFTIDDEGNETADSMSPLLVEVCDPFFYVTSLICIYRSASSGDNKMIEFEGKVVLWNGTTRIEKYKFASGRYPENLGPVPIRVKGNPVEKLDIVIVPDSDLKGTSITKPWTNLRWLLDDLVDDQYFDYEAILAWRGLYNLYYSREDGDYSVDAFGNCVFDSVPDLAAGSDSLLYAHAALMRDCTLTDRFSAESWYGKSILHESGHALVGLRDEYQGANYGIYGPHVCMSNIFKDKAKCVSEAPGIGLPASYCKQIEAYWNVWRIDPADATGSLMGPAQHYAWSDFGPASMRRINWRYGLCLDGDCMKYDPCDETEW